MEIPGDPAAGNNSAASISAVKPAMAFSTGVCGVVAFYNITWDSGRFKKKQDEDSLAQDLQKALNEFMADLVLLSECGEIGVGLPRKKWVSMIRDVCGSGFLVCHQSHYTSIVRLATLKVTKDHRQKLCTIPYSPSLEGWRCEGW